MIDKKQGISYGNVHLVLDVDVERCGNHGQDQMPIKGILAVNPQRSQL